MEKTLLRFTTTGSVDDGKSTLIGRLLYETNCIFEDQYKAIENTSKRKGNKEVDLALLLDGLSAEREQGITIDVAYRYFSTLKRKFIIADTPGHEQYTRNMITGASTADLAIILIDAHNGVLTQSKRHGFLISLLQIPHLVVAINKMDLVDYRQEVYENIINDYMNFSQKLDIHDITFIPVSALKGDNIVTHSKNMPWYKRDTLLHFLENVHISADINLIDFRFPIQYVIRSNPDFRGYAGKILSGIIRKNEEIAILPSGKTTRIKSIITRDGELTESFAGQSIVITLEDQIDISRGDMIVRKNNLPQISNHFEAIICWMDNIPLSESNYYILKHTTMQVKAFITKIVYRININTLHREKTEKFFLNEIGRVEIKTVQSIYLDSYKMNHATGNFILIDPISNHTVAAGMIRGISYSINDISKYSVKAKNITPQKEIITRRQWEEYNKYKALVLWFTGLSGSGKSTIARKITQNLFNQNYRVMLLDGDNIRHGLCRDLDFSSIDRAENIRRAGEVAKLFFNQGNIVLCTFISPFRKDRYFVRELFPKNCFIEIYVKCDINICQQRDSKGLYKKVKTGNISEFTGIDSPYEEPEKPQIIIDTQLMNIKESVIKVEHYIFSQGILK